MPSKQPNKPITLISQIAIRCRVYPGDTDSMRVSASRLSSFIEQRDQAMLNEAQAIRKELTEQKQMIASIKKYRSNKPPDAKGVNQQLVNQIGFPHDSQ